MTDSDQEIWKNVSRGKRGILRAQAGSKPKRELVNPGREVVLTRADREAYHRVAADDSLDVFKNGALVPVEILDETVMREFADNPNLITEDDMVKLFKMPQVKFEEKLGQINNIYALERMMEIAENSENIAVRKYKRVSEKMTGLTEAEKDKAATSAQRKAASKEKEFMK